jgi:predicted acylesterase/phospholipase RssA
MSPVEGIYWFGILWFLPLLVLVGLVAQIVYEASTAPTDSPLAPPTGENDSLRSLLKDKPDLRIGIILAGGGAKGAYQAGAMRALHEFLERYGALDNVEMIAGTSIGSWNALFWLAGLVAPAKKGELSEHERWWYTAGIRRIAEFSTYWIFGKNSVLTTRPWQANFDEIFGGDNLKARWQKIGIPGNGSEPAMRFYLTRSNVRTGRLAFGTNWNAGLRDAVNAGSNRINRKDGDADATLGDATEVRTTEDLKAAVFASMDLPPLFPYYEFAPASGDSAVDYFEDGGVVDNLPVMFGTSVENCDLLFVFPLNASFEQSVERKSILGRMLRVLDVRQGVLERNSMRLAYVHNQILDLKGKKALRVFAICPNRPLRVGTGEFWKTLDFTHCFRLMYGATWAELNRFDFGVAPTGRPDDEKTWIKMAVVDDCGEVTYTGDF